MSLSRFWKMKKSVILADCTLFGGLNSNNNVNQASYKLISFLKKNLVSLLKLLNCNKFCAGQQGPLQLKWNMSFLITDHN